MSALTITIPIPEQLEKALIPLVLFYRKMRYGYTFRRIKLTQGKYAIVDPEDFEILNQYKWSASRKSNGFYALRSVRNGSKITTKYLHRHIMESQLNSKLKIQNLEFTNSPCELVVDHINRNSLDNRKANLRLVTPTQNAQNRSPYKNSGISKYKGVHWAKKSKKWGAILSMNNKIMFKAYFTDEKEAALAYDAAARKYHGEFAVLNFPKLKAS